MSLDMALFVDLESSYPRHGIEDVLDFRKDNKTIQVILTTSTPMEVVLGFHSSTFDLVITLTSNLTSFKPV